MSFSNFFLPSPHWKMIYLLAYWFDTLKITNCPISSYLCLRNFVRCKQMGWEGVASQRSLESSIFLAQIWPSGILAPIFQFFSSPHPTEVIFKLQFYPKTIFHRMPWKVLHFLFSSGTVPQPHPLGLGIYFGLCKSHMFSLMKSSEYFASMPLVILFFKEGHSVCDLPGAEM